MVALLDDRANVPGWALAQMTLGAGVLFGLVRFSGDRRLRRPAAWLIVAYFASTLALGLLRGGAVLARGPLRADPGTGGIPVETRSRRAWTDRII